MTNKELKIAYTEYTATDQLEQVEQELVEAAIEATKTSYAPYSNFNVGAAVRLEDGQIVKGSNQENAAYPSGICAERTAMFYLRLRYLCHSQMVQQMLEQIKVCLSLTSSYVVLLPPHKKY